RGRGLAHPADHGDAALPRGALGRGERRLLRRGARSHRLRVSRDARQAGPGRAHALGERCRRPRAGAPRRAHGRGPMPRPPRSPARDVRRARLAPPAVPGDLPACAIWANRFRHSYGATESADSRRAVGRAHELGCNFFDTADVYGHGHSEEVLGAALDGIRPDVIIATKVGGNFYNRDVNPLLIPRITEALGRPLAEVGPGAALPVPHDACFSPSYVRFAVEQSLRRLRTDYIDLLQLHNPTLGLIADPETYRLLDNLKMKAKTR